MDAATDASTNRAGHLDALEHDGTMLAAAAESAGPDTAVPTCPGWTIRDLVRHQGEVHRWATIVVRDGLSKPSAVPADHLGPLPDDDELIDWFLVGHARLLAALHAAPADLVAFRFLADPPPAAVFWARRQAHETEMHRIDAESATARLTPIAPQRAADGIDEMLTGFVPRPHMGLHAAPSRTLGVVPTDHAGAWHVSISEDPVVTTRGEAAADCTMRGTANDLYLALWNRLGTDSLDISGDAEVLRQFREHVKIEWR